MRGPQKIKMLLRFFAFDTVEEQFVYSKKCAIMERCAILAADILSQGSFHIYIK